MFGAICFMLKILTPILTPTYMGLDGTEWDREYRMIRKTLIFQYYLVFDENIWNYK